MSEDTVYINKCAIKQKTFDNGGSVLNCSFHVDELIIHKNENGWVNITICERRDVSEKGHTHYAKLNSYTPPTEDTQSQETNTQVSDDALPF
tara:strand:+ start:169 stop:444 length:276 start_codon:yes stop_codon:yes gene_type:complete